jgi:hypothetical protein
VGRARFASTESKRQLRRILLNGARIDPSVALQKPFYSGDHGSYVDSRSIEELNTSGEFLEWIRAVDPALAARYKVDVDTRN